MPESLRDVENRLRSEIRDHDTRDGQEFASLWSEIKDMKQDLRVLQGSQERATGAMQESSRATEKAANDTKKYGLYIAIISVMSTIISLWANLSKHA